MGQERVGDPRQPLQGFGVVRGQRLVGEVAARQDDGPAQALEQQVVQRRVRQEEPHAPIQGGRALRFGVHHAIAQRWRRIGQLRRAISQLRLALPTPLHEHDRPGR